MNAMWWLHAVVAVLVVVSGTETKATETITAVLIGATGSLSKKYLWQAMFDLHLRHVHTTTSGGAATTSVDFRFIGAARDEPSIGANKIVDIIKDVSCHHTLPALQCFNEKKRFLERVVYLKLKTDADYENLGQRLAVNVTNEIGRLFYLSVPPSTYVDITRSLNRHCRAANKNAFYRVILEKPFGSDLKSAQDMAASLSKHLDDREILRIDHYLGKATVKNIATFRTRNERHYESYWNSEHIERIEVAMLETEDCKDRTNFYDKYGVLRDVFQNHLTEVLSLVAMKLPSSLDPESIQHAKTLFLQSVEVPRVEDAVLAQYKHYNEHYRADHDLTHGERSSTPTYAQVTLHSNDETWKNTAFVLLAGKQLHERAAYAKVVFRSNSPICHKSSTCEILFSIQGGTHKHAAIVVSDVLPRPDPFGDWSVYVHEHTYTATPKHSLDLPYSSLLALAVDDNRSLFVGTSGLLESWRIWTPLIKTRHHLLFEYEGGATAPIPLPHRHHHHADNKQHSDEL